MRKWTAEQQKILDASGNILVSASAGSGKTTVMVQKILDIVTKNATDVDEVLVMTYTNASAADMRAKIISKLYDTVKKVDISEELKERVKFQLDNLSFSDIGTADAFCGKLIRENFERLGVSPTALQMDEDESAEMKRRIINRLIAEEYENRNADFLSIVNKITKIVDDTPIADVVLKLYDASRIHPNPTEFKEMLLRSADDNPDGFYGREILRFYADAAADMLPFADRAEAECNLSAAPGYATSLTAAIEIIRAIASAESPDELGKKLAVMEVPAVGKNNSLTDEDKARVNAVRGAAKDLIACLNKNLYVDYTGYNVAEAKKYVRVVMRLVDAFGAAYAAEKTAACKLDFNDLSQYAMKLLSDEETAKSIASKYRFIFIDEYQDINPLQEEIIKKLSRGNVFMVGDGKQGIYAFRNAEPRIMNEKRKQYTGDNGEGSALDMTVNFRSTENILTFCDDVFSVVMDDSHGGVDYGATSRFLSDNVTESPEKGAEVEINLFTVKADREDKIACTGVYSVENHSESAETEEVFGYREGAEIAKRIKQLIGKPFRKNDADKTVAHYEYSDVAVLFKNRSCGAEGFLRALTDNDIPYISDGFVSDAGKPYIKQLISFLKVLDNFSDNISATGFLLSWFGGFTENEVYLVRATLPEGSVEDAVKNTATRGDELGVKCRAALSTVEKWRSRAAYVPVDVLLDEVITETGFDAYVLSRPSGGTELHAVDVFIRGRCAGGTVQSFLDNYENSDKKGVPLPPADFGNAVRVATVHGSKGLEYPAVFLARIDANGKRPDNSDIVFDKDLGIGLKFYNDALREKKNSPAYIAIELERKRRENSENIRLFYVALTRAMRFLSLSGAADKNLSTKLKFPQPRIEISTFYDLLLYAAAKNSRLLGKVREVKDLPFEKHILDDISPAVFNKPEKLFFDEISRVVNFVYEYYDATVVSPKYTVSELNRSADDTVYVRSITGGEDNRTKGIAYHTVMENIDFSFTTISEVNEFILSLAEKGYLTEEDAALVDGEQILACINNPIIKEGIKGRYLREKPFMLRMSAAEIGDCPSDDKVLIQGTADLILFGEKTVIIDFKYSGLPDAKLADKYKKQLNLYEMAVETAFKVKVNKKLLYSFNSGHFIEIK